MSATVAPPYKVRIKLGQAEFDAEGPEQTVKDQLASFLELASLHPVAAPQYGNGNGPSNGPPDGTRGVNGGLGNEPLAQAAITQEIAQRLFTEVDGLVSLRRLPVVGEERNADVLFLILLGYLQLRKQEKVKASELLAAAKQSGIRLTRIDHVLDRFEQLVTRGGFKRGSWYCLTNPGQEHAEQLASRVFG